MIQNVGCDSDSDLNLSQQRFCDSVLGHWQWLSMAMAMIIHVR